MSGLDASIHAKIQQYQQFIDKTLRRDLATCTQITEKIQQKHNEYSALRQSLVALQSAHESERASSGEEEVGPMKTRINIGNEFYMQAVVPNPTYVFVDVGLGFHVELRLDEAVRWIDEKLPTLQKRIDRLKQQTADIQSKIKLVYEGIAQIMQLQERNDEKIGGWP